MARKNKHNVDEVLNKLHKKQDVKVNDYSINVLKDYVINKKTDELEPNPNKKGDVGNGSWGMIDFLINYHGFHLYRVDKFGR